MRGNYSWMANRVNIDILHINPLQVRTSENKHNLKGLEDEIYFRFFGLESGSNQADCIGVGKGFWAARPQRLKERVKAKLGLTSNRRARVTSGQSTIRTRRGILSGRGRSRSTMPK